VDSSNIALYLELLKMAGTFYSQYEEKYIVLLSLSDNAIINVICVYLLDLLLLGALN
jgi:hypothetical protein